MRKYIKKLFNETLRKCFNLERAIIKIVDRNESSSTKGFIINMVNVWYPDMFSPFEIEYTIDQMVYDKKLVSDGRLYISAMSHSSIANEVKYNKKINAQLAIAIQQQQ